VVVGEPLEMMIEGVHAGRGQDAGLPPTAAQALAPDPSVGDEVGRPGQQ
jgi:hypothetical protein